MAGWVVWRLTQPWQPFINLSPEQALLIGTWYLIQDI